MGLFDKILEKLSFNLPAKTEPAQQAPPAPPAEPAAPHDASPIAVFDVVAQLEMLAPSNHQKAHLEGLDLGSAEAVGPREHICRTEGVCGGALASFRKDGRFGTDEHVVALDRVEEACRKRRKHSKGTTRLTDSVSPRVRLIFVVHKGLRSVSLRAMKAKHASIYQN